MFERAYLFIYRALTGVHCGAAEGESGLDLPVVRERFTRFPLLPGSSLKGVWREYCGKKWSEAEVKEAFGPEPREGETDSARPYSGCLSFNDAWLLFLPVRASLGTFCLISCPMQMARYLEARQLAGLECSQHQMHEFAGHEDDSLFIPNREANPANGEANPAHVLKGFVGQKVYLEDMKLAIKVDPTEKKKALLASDYFSFLPPRLAKRLALVSDDTFQWLANNCLEVVAHNKLTEKKTSDSLWYEEVVPAESVFCQLILSSRSRAQGKEPEEAGHYLDKLANTKVPFFQVGGHETKGRGFMEVEALNKSNNQAGGDGHA